jgi:hypothetical protein
MSIDTVNCIDTVNENMIVDTVNESMSIDTVNSHSHVPHSRDLRFTVSVSVCVSTAALYADARTGGMGICRIRRYVRCCMRGSPPSSCGARQGDGGRGAE